MGLIENLLKNMGYEKRYPKKPPIPAWYRASAGQEQYTIPDLSVYQNQATLYQKLSWVNVAVTLLSNVAASTRFKVVLVKNDKDEEVIDHPFEKLIKRPNPDQSQFDLLVATFSYLAINGNAYWHLNRYNEKMPPMEIWCIPSNHIKPIPSETMGIKHYEYDTGNGKPIIIPKWQIMHIKSFNPLSLFVGLSPMEPVATVAAGDMNMQKWNTNLFGKQNAKIPGAIAFRDNIADDDFEKLRIEIEQQWGGTSRYGPMLIRNAGDGVDYIKMGMDQSDLDFINSRSFNRDEIFSVYAPGLLSMISPNSTEANARIGKSTFTEFCLWPKLTLLGEKIDANVLSSYGENLSIRFDDIRVTDSVMALKKQQEYEKSHTVNEIRHFHYGDDPLTDERGDKFVAEIGSKGLFGQTTSLSRGSNADVASTSRNQEPANVKAELHAWMNYELKRIGKKTKRPFKCLLLEPVIQALIRAQLEKYTDETSIRTVFEEAEQWVL
jgi:HK97 family phage portal protein